MLKLQTFGGGEPVPSPNEYFKMEYDELEVEQELYTRGFPI